MTSDQTRQRPAAGEPGAISDRTSRTINLDLNSTPLHHAVEFVDDDQATGRAVNAADLWLLTVRFGPIVAASVAAGDIECRHDTTNALWFFRYTDMLHVSVEDVTDEMRARFARFMISEAA